MARLENTIPPYINGRFIDIQRPQVTFSCLNPMRPTDILAFTSWSKELTAEIIMGLKEAQRKFCILSLEERLSQVQRLINNIRSNAEEIKSQMMLELGRSKISVEEEWRFCEVMFQQLPTFCLNALSEKNNDAGWNFTYAPVGLVLISSTVSLPVYSVLCSLLPSLVAGNAVAIKPSSHCPLSGSALASCIHQSQLLPGLIQVVYGEFEIFRRLVLTHEFDAIFYTGGEEAREQIRKDLFSYQNTRLVLCSAGKNAAFVAGDVNIADTVKNVIYGMCVDSGQRSESTSLVFVENNIVSEFADKLVAEIKSLPIGVRDDLSSSNTHVMGPLCSNNARERFLRFQGIAYRESCETLRWGKGIDNPGNGFFVSPGVHLMSSEKVIKSVYASTPFFGPDIAIVPVSDYQEAIMIVDTLKAGHILSVFSNNEEQLKNIRAISNVPFLYWNHPTTDLNADLPNLTKGHPDNSHFNGLGFLFSTIFAKTLVSNFSKTIQTLFILLMIISCLGITKKASADYRNAVEGNDVVKGKFYPKAGKFQLSTNGGMVLNQPFIDTYLLSVNATYHINEWHAISIDGFFGLSSDRSERDCIENFMFAPDRASNADDIKNGSAISGGNVACDVDNLRDPKTTSDANEPMPKHISDSSKADKDAAWKQEKEMRGPYMRKPAYMPIREIKQMFTANYQFTPVYGKALWFLSFVGYVDIYASVGLGVALTDFYPRKETTTCYKTYNDPSSEVTQCPIAFDNEKDGNATAPFAGTSHPDGYGIAGRPLPISGTNPLAVVGAGTRFYIGRIMSKGRDVPAAEFMFNMELRNFSLIGTEVNADSSFMNFFGLLGGVGVLF